MGVVLALMNACFYIAIDRLPLGTVAAIEFLPVIVLAAVGMRTARNAVALGSARRRRLSADRRALEGEPIGVAFAFANAALFAAYIVLAHRVAQHGRMGGIDGLGAAMLVATVVITPIGLWSAAPALLDPIAVAAAVGVGISSSVIPYVFDQLAMARLTRAAYSLMVSLLPATATVVGIVVLAQIPSWPEVVGVGLVVRGGGRAPRGSADGLMEYVRLGTSGLRVSRICLGMMSYGDPAVRAWQLPEEEAEPIVRHAVEAGVTFFDTADMYSRGRARRSQDGCWRSSPERDDYVLATKVYFPTGPGPNDRGLSRKHLLAAIDASLRRLAPTTSTSTRSTAGTTRPRSRRRWRRFTTSSGPARRATSARPSMYAWEFAKAQYTAQRARLDALRLDAEPLQPRLPRRGARDDSALPRRGRRGAAVEPARPRPARGEPDARRRRDHGQVGKRSSRRRCTRNPTSTSWTSSARSPRSEDCPSRRSRSPGYSAGPR